MTSTDLVRLSIDDMARVSKALAESGRFDARDSQQAFVQVLAGQEMGIPPFAAITGIHIIKGKPSIGAGLLAGLVKAHPRYDYRVLQLDDECCHLEFTENGEAIGRSEFGMSDAQRAGLLSNDTWKKYPRNMLFARALSNGVAWYCPDVTVGRVYSEDDSEDELDDPTPEPPPPASRKLTPVPVEAEPVEEIIEDAEIVEPVAAAPEVPPEGGAEQAEALADSPVATGSTVTDADDDDLVEHVALVFKEAALADDCGIVVAGLLKQLGWEPTGVSDAERKKPTTWARLFLGIDPSVASVQGPDGLIAWLEQHVEQQHVAAQFQAEMDSGALDAEAVAEREQRMAAKIVTDAQQKLDADVQSIPAYGEPAKRTRRKAS